MITPDSRYRDSQVVLMPVGRTLRETIVPSAQTSWTFAFSTHTVVAGDAVDTLAADYYGDERMWWVIADANPEILDWFTLTPGTVLRVPSG